MPFDVRRLPRHVRLEGRRVSGSIKEANAGTCTGSFLLESNMNIGAYNIFKVEGNLKELEWPDWRVFGWMV